MAGIKKSPQLKDEKIINKIYLLRGKKVMLDFDLAEMYMVATKHLKRQINRNSKRFPPDFMFILKKKEFENLRSQIGTSSWGGTRYMPMAFTEQGVAMLSSVLNSQTAIEVNIQIIRVFTRMRELLSTHRDIMVKLEGIEKNMLRQGYRMKAYEKEIEIIFNALKELLTPPKLPRQRIGFRRNSEKE